MTEEHKRKIGLANKGKIISEEHKLKISKGNLGKRRTDEMKAKLKGRVPWNKGKKGLQVSWSKGTKGVVKGYWKGKKRDKKTIEALRKSRLGKKDSIETRIKKSLLRTGSKSLWWKGGITPINKRIRNSFEYVLWRNEVYKRDNWTCLWCKKRGKRLNADHIKPFSLYPESRFVVENGRTLCHECHKKTSTYGGNIKTYTATID